MTRARGRPRKVSDTIESGRLPGIAEAQSIYNESRRQCNKHSSALTDAATLSSHPMSESSVKRILAELQPKNAQIVPLFERKEYDDEARKRYEWIKEQVVLLRGDTDRKTEGGAKLSDREPKVYTLRLAERPNYPRHNRKSDSEE